MLLAEVCFSIFFRGCKQSNFSTRLSDKGRNFNHPFSKKPVVLKKNNKAAISVAALNEKS